MCADMSVDRREDMCVDRCIDMCVDRCIDTSSTLSPAKVLMPHKAVARRLNHKQVDTQVYTKSRHMCTNAYT